MEDQLKKLLIVAVLLFIALLSVFVIADKAGSVESHAATIASLDEKADTVLRLTATSTLASAGISAIPGDTATPIAEKMADFTEYFLLILCVLYAEKYLVTVIGAGTFKILIPCACALLGVSLFRHKDAMRKLAYKLAVFGLALFVMIPLSIRVSDMVYDSYRLTISETITDAEQFSDDTAEFSGTEDESVIASILSRLSETASGLADRAARILNNFVESLAVMIVTSCIIPILVLVFFLWLIKLLTGIEIAPPLPGKRKKESKGENV